MIHMKQLLVTGGAGFIGSNFIRQFMKNNSEIKIVNLDKLTYAGRKENLQDLESNFEKLKQMIPEKQIWLGCYMWDFGNNKPMPKARMKKQCRLGLKWLRQGCIEGMIFLGTNICDLNLETVEWTRQWIAQVGDEPL